MVSPPFRGKGGPSPYPAACQHRPLDALPCQQQEEGGGRSWCGLPGAGGPFPHTNLDHLGLIGAGSVREGQGQLGEACRLVHSEASAHLTVEGEDAERLKLELQFARRSIDQDTRDQYIQALRRAGMKRKEIARAAHVSTRVIGAALSLEKADPQSLPQRMIDEAGRSYPARRKKTGSNRRRHASGGDVIPMKTHAAEGARPTSKQVNEEMQRASMRNAPAGSLNLPGLRRARAAQRELRELSALDHDKFLTQVPPEACREFDPDLAEWWLRFCQLARACATEHGQPAMWQKSPANGGAPTLIQPAQERVMSALREHGGAMSVEQLSNELGLARAYIGRTCLVLREMGLVGCDVRQKPWRYRATAGAGSDDDR